MAEPLRATFFALRKRDKAVLLPATSVTLVFVALIVAAFVALNWATLTLMWQAFQLPTGEVDEEFGLRMVSGFFALFGWAFLLAFPLYIALAAYEAACLRWMIRGEAPGLFGITLGADTWRVYGVYWCWFLAHMVVGFALSIVMVPVMFMTMGDLIMNPEPDPANMLAWQLKVQLPMTLIQYVVLIFIGVRFSPAAATSVARRRFSFFEAWTVTRDRFWALFGSWAALWLLFAIIYVVVAAATYGPVLYRVLPEIWAAARNPSPESNQAIATAIFSRSTGWALALGYLGAALVAFAYAIMSFGVNARAALAALEEEKIAVESEGS